MKTWMIRFASALPGFLLLMNAVGLAVAPEGVVTSLGMTYLDGLGRSSQVGDTGAFLPAAVCLLCLAHSGRGHSGLWLGALCFWPLRFIAYWPRDCMAQNLRAPSLRLK